MNTNYLVIKRAEFTYRIIRFARTISELHIECVYKNGTTFCRWYRIITDNTRIYHHTDSTPVTTTTDVSQNVDSLWIAFRDDDANNVLFPTELKDPFDSLDLYVHTINCIKLFPVNVNINDYFSHTLYDNPDSASSPCDTTMHAKIEAFNSKMVQFRESSLKNFRTSRDKLEELTLRLNAYDEKIQELAEQNRILTFALETVISQMGLKDISEPEETIDEYLVEVCEIADPFHYSGLAMIPKTLTDGEKTFTRSLCAEATSHIFIDGTRLVINYCEWLDDDNKKIATSFHIHICFPNGDVISGVYTDAFSASNVIRPRTIFQNIIKCYQLSIDESILDKLYPNRQIVHDVRVNIKIPADKSDKTFTVYHDVLFASHESKKYQKTVLLYDSTYVMGLSDIQRACESRTDIYSSMKDREYVTACMNYDIDTYFS